MLASNSCGQKTIANIDVQSWDGTEEYVDKIQPSLVVDGHRQQVESPTTIQGQGNTDTLLLSERGYLIGARGLRSGGEITIRNKRRASMWDDQIEGEY